MAIVNRTRRFLLVLAVTSGVAWAGASIPGAPAGPPPARTPTPARTPPAAPTPSATPEPEASATYDLDALLKSLGQRAHAYETVALRFVCIETLRTSDDPKKERRFDYMYVEAQEQRYRPFRQAHTGRLGKTVPETPLNFSF